MHTRQFSSQGTGWISAHIQSSCEEGQQLICLKCREHERLPLSAAGAGQRQSSSQAAKSWAHLSTALVCVSGCRAFLLRAMMQRGPRHEWGDKLPRYERLDAHYCGAASTSWTFMNHAKASPIVLYIQLSKTDREQKRCKNACSQFIRQPIAAPFVARLSTVNPITVVTKIGQSVSKHTGCISAPA